jgi:hypothetical protein
LDKNRRGDDFIDFINDGLVALDELEIPRQRKSMDKVKNWYGNKLLELYTISFCFITISIQGNAIFFFNP